MPDHTRTSFFARFARAVGADRRIAGERPRRFGKGCRAALTVALGVILTAPRTWPAEPVEPPPPVQLEGPDITLIEGEDRAIFEFRTNGRLTMVRIVPNIGKPYYLVPKDPTRGWDDLERADGLVPQWVLFRF